MRRFGALSLGVMLAAGCGGGDNGIEDADATARGVSAPASAPAPRTSSPGGIWHTTVTGDESITLFVAETGEMTVMQSGPAVGAGAVMVYDGDRITGTYSLRRTATDADADGGDESCTLEGTIVERVALRLTLTCGDSANPDAAARRVSLVYDAAYESDASLADVAGNYTLAFDEQSNILTISADGAAFGMYDNGPVACTVNGTVEIIDPEFSLLRIELTFANCLGSAAGRYEGETMTGLGWRGPPGSAAGSILVMLTELIDTRFEYVSVLYEPA